MARRQLDQHVEPTGPAVGLDPVAVQPRARVVVDDAQIEPVSIDDASGAVPGRSGSSMASPGVTRCPCPPVSPRHEVDPPHVGQPEVVDVRVHRRDHEVAGQDRPVVPPLVHAEAAVRFARCSGRRDHPRADGFSDDPSATHRSTGSVSSRSDVVTGAFYRQRGVQPSTATPAAWACRSSLSASLGLPPHRARRARSRRRRRWRRAGPG